MIDLDKLNTATKYPSILTYHKMGDKGRLTDEVQVQFDEDEEVVVTEKIDGTNGRIVYLPAIHRYIIGSREEFLYGSGDLIFNATYGIVEALQPVANKYQFYGTSSDEATHVSMYYFEVFGGKNITRASKQYSSIGEVGVRIFDVAWFDTSILDLSRSEISIWRQHGGQRFDTEDSLSRTMEQRVSAVAVEGSSLPRSIADCLEWMQERYPQTRCLLDPEAGGRPEGVVIRNHDRSKIAKLRFKDYERTLR